MIAFVQQLGYCVLTPSQLQDVLQQTVNHIAPRIVGNTMKALVDAGYAPMSNPALQALTDTVASITAKALRETEPLPVRIVDMPTVVSHHVTRVERDGSGRISGAGTAGESSSIEA